MRLITNINCKKVDLTALTDWVGAKYLPGVDTLTIAYNDRLLDRLSGEVELLGISVKTSAAHCYNIFLQEGIGQAVLPEVICHELWHVKQMEDGRLDYDMAANTYNWEGEIYGNIPYDERPWEQEAFKNQIYKQFKNR